MRLSFPEIGRRFGFVVLLAAGVVSSGQSSIAASSGGLAGSIIGFVADPAGVPQMGATVQLYNRYERVIQKVLTNERGAFGFDALLPDVYMVRVSLTSFVPAVKRNILVQPGVRSFLSINLASVLSSIELVYTAPGQGAIMSDDWKWVLRSSMSTRPVLRLVSGIDISAPAPSRASSSNLFADTRGVVRLSASDMGAVSIQNEPDLGTAFALATSLFGSHQLHLSGNVGYSANGGMPTTGFRTSFAPTANGAEVHLTMRQVFLPARAGFAFAAGTADGTPALRTMTLSMSDRKQLTDSLDLEYGASLESITFLERLNFFSPFARVRYDMGGIGQLEFGYSSGVPPVEAGASSAQEPEFQRDFAALSAFPRVSVRDGGARVQRAENFEVAYQKSSGSRTVSVAAYHESISNAAITLAAPDNAFPATADLLPDLFSTNAVFNIGTFTRVGFSASLSQEVTENFSLTVAAGSGNALTAATEQLESNSAEELRNVIRHGRRSWAAARMANVLPTTGTRLVTSYQWSDSKALTPPHRYLTQRLGYQPGLNVQVRQPLGSVPGIGRLEANAEMRNLLAQGYLPINLADGKRLVVIHSPRSLRGGLSLIF
jgi:hypothetical protein